MRLLPALISALVCTLTTVDAFGVLPQSALWSETSAAKQCSADAGPGSAQAEAPYLAAGGAEGVGVRGVVSWRGERAGQDFVMSNILVVQPLPYKLLCGAGLKVLTTQARP